MTAAEDLARLAEDYWEGVLRRDPTLATFYGDDRYGDQLPDVGASGRADTEVALGAVLGHLDTIPRDDLTPDDLVTWDMLRLAAQGELDRTRLRLDELAVDQMDGPQVWLPQLLNWAPTDTPVHVAQLLARYRAFPRYMDQYLANLQDGVHDGRTAPRIAVERVLGQLQALLVTPPAESPLVTGASGLADADRSALEAATAEAIYPAYQRMVDFLAGDYLAQHARTDPGVWAVAGGTEIYATLARQHTTTDLTPKELHQVGRDDLASIQAEMRQVMARLGDLSGDIRAFTERLTRDTANLPASRQQIVAETEALLTAAQAALPRAFGRLPRTPCAVKAIEDYRERDSVAAFYQQASEDGSRPGTFYVNTFEPTSRPRHTLPALTFHEAVPGHHLQIALAQEAAGLPTFRRLSAGLLTNAFVEGWALYTERLADELGLYPSDQARFGMLGYQAWRACRLIVDTGLHHLRWTRQQAIDFFFENVGLTERETVNEVDRYIIWPGQALSYKVGQREIQLLRREAEQRLGPRFDLRAFHDEVLRHAALPLSTLRLTIAAWSPT